MVSGLQRRLQKLAAACDLTLPCKLYPHTDFHDRGVEAVELLLEMIRGGLKPVTAMRRLPMLPYIVTTQDGLIPAEVNDVCRKLAARTARRDRLLVVPRFPLRGDRKSVV